jgi:4-amino-4-deoxy-L-arabinose transferase-like glycosyltransferase
VKSDSHRRDSWIVVAAALVVRAVVVLWASSRFPPTADGTFYHRIADRMAQGLGYTWLWPDGVVTYAGHYPVGYPALVAAGYALFGAHPGVAMALNALVGSLAAVAVHRLSLRATSPRLAMIAGLIVAFHPGLVAYTPALMSEGVTASLVTCAAWITGRVRDVADEGTTRPVWKWLILLGIVVGLATLVRPQSIVFAPLFALVGVTRWMKKSSWKRVIAAVGAATIATFVLISPWTARNCARMGRCALVSYNGGWNLLIGADSASTGAWSPIKVPFECSEVWDEAAKDECFGRAARRYIAQNPADWLGLVTRKLAATFHYCGAAGWYLHESNGAACDDRCKVVLGGAETVYERLLLLLGLVWASKDSWSTSLLRKPSLAPLMRLGVALVGLVFLVQTHAWVSYVAFVVTALLRGRDLVRGSVLAACTVLVVGMTAIIHAVFFGAGRYGMVTFPLLAGVAVLTLAPKPSDNDEAAPVASGFGAQGAASDP